SNLKKSLWYFDFPSILEPLKTWSTDEITIKKAPDLTQELYGKQFIVHGKVLKTGYMTYIRKQALKRDVQGYTRKYGSSSIEVVLVGEDKKELGRFREICQRRTKKYKVESIEEKEVLIDDKTLKLGFEILTTKKK